jgi:hypothetical protein
VYRICTKGAAGQPLFLRYRSIPSGSYDDIRDETVDLAADGELRDQLWVVVRAPGEGSHFFIWAAHRGGKFWLSRGAEQGLAAMKLWWGPEDCREVRCCADS